MNRVFVGALNQKDTLAWRVQYRRMQLFKDVMKPLKFPKFKNPRITENKQNNRTKCLFCTIQCQL